MAAESGSSLREYVHRVAQEQELATVPDGSLLDKFVTERDEFAFSTLVQRHGQMVWAVCRRMLPNHHDTEEAFQATFLVLALKAASIIPRGMVANWLHGVAYYTALKARAIAARRRRTEVQVREMPDPVVEEQAPCPEVRALIDEELCRLPDRHRAVVVLCDLEGNTRSEAARHLNVPEGTIAGWLTRGREKLAKRLSQRGVALSGGGLALVLSHTTASGQVSVAMLSSTTKVAIAVAGSRAMTTATISPPAISLTKGVLKSMFIKRFKLPLACLVVGLVGVAGIGLTHFADAGQSEKKQATPDKPLANLGQPLKEPKTEKPPGDMTSKLKGTWVNVDGGSDFKKIIIKNKDDNDKTNGGWTVTWTQIVSTGKEEEGDELGLHLLLETYVGGDREKLAKSQKEHRLGSAFATWESMERGKKLSDQHMVFRIEGELLVVDSYRIPTGHFFPSHWRCEYKKQK